MKKRRKWIGFYGDDFTGSTDAMEALALSGIRTVLFLRPPSPDLLEDSFADIQAFGIAGVSRSLNPEQMEKELRTAFRALKDSNAAVCHYKTCSTFDSSPQIGSIGKAIEIAMEMFEEQRFIPLVVGVPTLKRYTVFGNHFATLDGNTYRLDQHPVMSKHPMTPMDEADLRKHLSKQTALPIELIDILELSDDVSQMKQRLEEKLKNNPSIVLFDVLDNDRLQKIGVMIWEETSKGQLFVAGSSGIEYALTAAWKKSEQLNPEPPAFPSCGPAEPMLVVSGSCSTVTRKQIDYAMKQGFAGIKVSGEELIDPEMCEQSLLDIVCQADALLSEGRSVVIYSALGPEDPSIAMIRNKLNATGRKTTDTGKFLGEQLGRICKEVIRRREIKRAVIAGGDTSGYVLKELDVFAMEVVMPITPGGPLCKTFSDNPQFDGLELSLKGGQVGGEDFIVKVKMG